MPSITGYVTDEQEEFIEEELIENGRFENKSEVVQYLIMWSLDVKYGFSTEDQN